MTEWAPERGDLLASSSFPHVSYHTLREVHQLAGAALTCSLHFLALEPIKLVCCIPNIS